MNSFENLLTTQQFTEESIVAVIFNLLLCLLLVSFVGWFYKKYSRSLGGKTHVGSVLPLIGLTVFMVITVVKSSLALSLGLVGALSIVRFRTPIKEPEELGYLFLTIAIGLGLGAGFKLITILVTLIILAYLYLTNPLRKISKVDGEYTLVINSSQDTLNDITASLESNVIAYRLVRIETNETTISAYFNISVSNSFHLQSLINELKQIDESVDLNLVESGVNW